MQLSWEQLNLSAAAERRKRARTILDLGQLIVAGDDKNAWKKKQEQLLKEIRIGL